MILRNKTAKTSEVYDLVGYSRTLVEKAFRAYRIGDFNGYERIKCCLLPDELDDLQTLIDEYDYNNKKDRSG